MRPHPALTALFFMNLTIGALMAMSFFAKDGGAGDYQQKGIFTLIITGLFAFFLAIVALSKFRYTHLWKKNSSHARHKQHTQYHPAIREEERRQQRKQRQQRQQQHN